MQNTVDRGSFTRLCTTGLMHISGTKVSGYFIVHVGVRSNLGSQGNFSSDLPLTCDPLND